MRIHRFLSVFLLAAVLPAGAATGLDEFAQGYRDAPASLRPELVETFIEGVRESGGTPLVGTDGRVTFIYFGTGAEKEIRLVGDFRTSHHHRSNWDIGGESMAPVVEGGVVYFARLPFEPDARIDYQFVVDGERRVDPLNAYNRDGGIYGEVSELRMPGYQEPVEAELRPDVPRGTITVVDEPTFSPKVRVYLPAGYDKSQKYPVVYTADGSAWLEWMDLAKILDNLIAEGAVEPVIAVMVDSAEDRRSWYFFNPDYLEYLKKVIGHVDEHYSTRADPGGRLHIGSSSGGRAALYAGLERPDLFHNLGLFSPSLVGSPHYYEPYLTGKKSCDTNMKIWMSAGTYEGSIYEDTKLFEGVFKRAGLPCEAVYTPEGHSFYTWRHLIDDMLRYFYGSEQNEIVAGVP